MPNKPEQEIVHSAEPTEKYQDRLIQIRQRDQQLQEAEMNRELRATSNTALIQVQSAIRQKTLLREQVVSVAEDSKSAYLVIKHPDLKVIVRFEESSSFLPEDLLNNTEKSTILRQKMMLTKMVDSYIDYIPYAITKDETGKDVVIASRRMAMRVQRHRYFLDTKRVQEGDIVDADVLSVAPHSLLICILGVDCIVPVHKLSYRPMEDLTNFYYPGDTIRIKITKLSLLRIGKDGIASAPEGDSKPNHVELEVSGKEAELEEVYPRLKHMIEVNHRYSATVVSSVQQKSKDNKMFTLYRLYLTVGYPARASSIRANAISGNKSLRIGDRVLFEVRGFDEYGLATGDICKYLRSR